MFRLFCVVCSGVVLKIWEYVEGERVRGEGRIRILRG